MYVDVYIDMYSIVNGLFVIQILYLYVFVIHLTKGSNPFIFVDK